MPQQTFKQVTALWKADKRQWVKPSTYATYVQHVNKHLLPFFGSMTPEEINEPVVQNFVNIKMETLTVSSIRDALMILRMILRYGSKRCGWPQVEFDVRFPTTCGIRRDVSVLSPANQKKLMDYIKNNISCRNLGILICLYSGLRIGEVCGLQWKDLDVAAGALHVNKTVQRIWLCDGDERSYSLSIASPKTLTSVRDIPISRELMKYIRPLRRLMPVSNYVLSNAPEPLEPRYYRDYFRRTLASLGIPPIRFHALRHSFATRCIEGKCDYKTVSVLLGHASISTTMDLYVHPGFKDKKLVIDRLSKVL